MDEQHKKELKNSCISDSIISLNFSSLQGECPYSHLLYNLGREERRNDGRLKDKWLNSYAFLDKGGWWCGGGIDLATLNNSALINQCYGSELEWGCFKPNAPRRINGKPIKYEHPPHAQTEVFTLKIGEEDFIKIGQKIGEEESALEALKSDILNIGGDCPSFNSGNGCLIIPCLSLLQKGRKNQHRC